MDTRVQLTGRVTAGLGKAGPATQLDWFRAAMRRLWGFEPATGTLNVIVEGDWRPMDRLLLNAGTVVVPPSPDVCCSIVLPARLEKGVRTVPVILFRPLVDGYNPAQVELLSAICLRDALDLRDGDQVRISAENRPPAVKWVAG
ncbi:MAG: DUF120 domain-containing protein [Symbiobacterium sp.]|uniref:DUF120 domain-containing protein n=1 Tax=Symbiobacterium sp. TaxID=1971213 RepID=UPI0034644E37